MRRFRGLIDRWLTPNVILVAGWLWFLVYAFPGYMSYDSTWQLGQARGLTPVSDWHPPLMQLVWHGLDSIIAGPILMLVLQSTLFLVGTYVILRTQFKDRIAATIAVVLTLLPANIVVMAVIWKDSQMAGFLIAGFAALLSPRRAWRVVGYILIALAIGYRYNAAAAAFPILIYTVGRGGRFHGWKRVGIAVVVWLAMVLVTAKINAALTEAEEHPWQVAAAPVEVAGIIRFAPHLDNDQLLADTPGVPWHKRDKIQIRVRTWYHPENQFLVVTQEPGQVFDYISTPEQREGITNAFKLLVRRYPIAYLKHRVGVFWAQLMCEDGGAGGVFADFENPVWAPHLSHEAKHSSIQDAWITTMRFFDQTPMYRVGLYFALLIALIPFAWRNHIALVVLLSGLCHQLGLFPSLPAIDYRYSQWMVACALIGLVMVFVDRATAWSQSRRG